MGYPNMREAASRIRHGLKRHSQTAGRLYFTRIKGDEGESLRYKIRWKVVPKPKNSFVPRRRRRHVLKNPGNYRLLIPNFVVNR